MVRLVRTFQEGDPEAAVPLWNAYFERLVRLALEHLRTHSSPDPRADSEDVAISAFHSFCQAVSEGRFPRLEDRHALWTILVVITRRKVFDLVAREHRQKRGGLHERLDAPVELLEARTPGPEEAAIAADLYWNLYARLGTDELRAAAQLHLEGWTVAEIAEFLGCSVSTIDRRLRRVREVAESLWGTVETPAS